MAVSMELRVAPELMLHVVSPETTVKLVHAAISVVPERPGNPASQCSQPDHFIRYSLMGWQLV